MTQATPPKKKLQEIADERQTRHRHITDRQKTILGMALASLLIIGILAALVFKGVFNFGSSEKAETVSSEQSKYRFPCLPLDTQQTADESGQIIDADGAGIPFNAETQESFPYLPSRIQLSVYNATGKTMLGTAVKEALANRGFVILELGNASTVMEETQIHFGLSGAQRAYTLAGHFTNLVFVLDDRVDSTIDLYVGEDFDDLLPEDEVQTIDTTKALQNPKGCVNASSITPEVREVPAKEESSEGTPEGKQTDPAAQPESEAPAAE